MSDASCRSSEVVWTKRRVSVKREIVVDMSLLGLSVAVDVFTLVCISVERYLAICRPLLILKLQSIDCSGLFNGLILILIWSLGLLIALPNLFMYNLCSLPQLGRFKCEKTSLKQFDERVYMITLLGETLSICLSLSHPHLIVVL